MCLISNGSDKVFNDQYLMFCLKNLNDSLTWVLDISVQSEYH